MSILIYGATGYTGRLCAAEAKARGLDAILAGRNAKALDAVARPLGLEAIAFDLNEHIRLAKAVSRVRAVLHVAGPFSVTARPMVEACLTAGVHYLDVCGEFRVLEWIAAQDAAARERGVMLLPAAGFAVVPSDCLLAHVAARAGKPTDLSLVVDWRGGASRGTLRTGAEMLRDGIVVRRDGAMVPAERRLARHFVLDGRRARCVAFNFGDIFTAPATTGAVNVTVYFRAASEAGVLAALPAFLRRALTSRLGMPLLRGVFALMPEGPDTKKGGSRSATMFAFAEGGVRPAAAKQIVPHPYLFTARVAVDLARRAAAGEARPGWRTPSQVYGANYVLGFEGVTRTDLPAG